MERKLPNLERIRRGVKGSRRWFGPLVVGSVLLIAACEGVNSVTQLSNQTPSPIALLSKN